MRASSSPVVSVSELTHRIGASMRELGRLAVTRDLAFGPARVAVREAAPRSGHARGHVSELQSHGLVRVAAVVRLPDVRHGDSIVVE